MVLSSLVIESVAVVVIVVFPGTTGSVSIKLGTEHACVKSIKTEDRPGSSSSGDTLTTL